MPSSKPTTTPRLTITIDRLAYRDGTEAEHEDVLALTRAMQTGGALWLDGAGYVAEVTLHLPEPEAGGDV